MPTQHHATYALYKNHQQILAACSTLLCTLYCAVAFTQPFPTKPMRIIVPYLAGGGVDTAARVMAPKMAEYLGKPILIENKPGAATNIGSDHVAKSPADGYTMLLANSSQIANVSIYGKGKMPYDLRKDLSPLALIGITPLLLVVHPSLPVRSAKDLITLARAHPGKLTYASAGIGSPTHIAPELFKSMARLSMLHIPYKGGSQAITDLLGGQTSLYFSAMSTGLPLAKSGRLRALGVTSPQRFVGLADIPTIAESGLPGYSLVGWFGLLLPANTPLDTVNRLHDAANRVLATPEIKDRLILEGIEAQAQTVQAFDSFLQKELEKYAKIVRDARILPE